MTCTVCKKKYNKLGVRIKKFELVAAWRKITLKFQNHQVSFKKLTVMNVENYKLFIHMHQHKLHVIHAEMQLQKQQALKQKLMAKSQAALSKS